MEQLSRWLIFLGLGFLFLGAAVWLANRFGIPIGKLPGDLAFKGESVSFYFPISTSIIISIILTILLNIFLRK